MCDTKTQSVRSATVVAGSQHQRPHAPAPLCLHQLQHLSPSASRKQTLERIPAHVKVSDRWGGQQQAAEQQSYIGHPPSCSSAAGTSVPPVQVLRLSQATIDLLGSDAFNIIFERGNCCIFRLARVFARDCREPASNPHTFHRLPCFIALWGNCLRCAAKVYQSQ